MYRPKLYSPRLKWLCAVSLAFACGCSGSNEKFKNAKEPSLADVGADAGDVGDVTSAIDPTLASSQDELISAECSLLNRCCSAQELEDRFGIDGVDGECDEIQSTMPNRLLLANLTTSIQAGRLQFDAAMAQLCAQSYLDQDCSEWTRLSPSETTLPGCIEMLIPQVEVGGDCKFGVECISGNCKHADAAGEFGTCTALAGEGDTCFDATCAEAFYCSTFDDACLPRKDDGQACLDDRECLSDACTSNADGEMRCSGRAPLCSEGLEN